MACARTIRAALRDGHENDVHHADATDTKSDGTDDGNKSAGRGDLTKWSATLREWIFPKL